MEPKSDLNSEVSRRFADCYRATDRSCGAIKSREEPVPCPVDLNAIEESQLTASERLIPLKEISPGLISQHRGPLRGPHDVKEDECRQEAV